MNLWPYVLLTHSDKWGSWSTEWEEHGEGTPGSYSDCALHQLCLWASVFSSVNFEHWPKPGSADSWPPGCACFSPWRILPGSHDVLSTEHLLQAVLWSLRRNPFIVLMKRHEFEPPFIYDGLNFTLSRAYSVRYAQWAGCWCWLQVHVSCTRPLTADVLLFTPPSLRLALLSAWPLIFPGVQGPIQMPLPLWNPSLNPPCSISHFFCCSHSTVPINYNASEMAMILILKPGALHQTSL